MLYFMLYFMHAINTICLDLNIQSCILLSCQMCVFSPFGKGQEDRIHVLLL